MISNQQGKALRMLFEFARHAELFNVRFHAEPGKPDIKRRKPGILFDQFTYWFSLQTSDYVVFNFLFILRHWRRHSKSATTS